MAHFPANNLFGGGIHPFFVAEGEECRREEQGTKQKSVFKKIKPCSETGR